MEAGAEIAVPDLAAGAASAGSRSRSLRLALGSAGSGRGLALDRFAVDATLTGEGRRDALLVVADDEPLPRDGAGAPVVEHRLPLAFPGGIVARLELVHLKGNHVVPAEADLLQVVGGGLLPHVGEQNERGELILGAEGVRLLDRATDVRLPLISGELIAEVSAQLFERLLLGHHLSLALLELGVDVRLSELVAVLLGAIGVVAAEALTDRGLLAPVLADRPQLQRRRVARTAVGTDLHDGDPLSPVEGGGRIDVEPITDGACRHRVAEVDHEDRVALGLHEVLVGQGLQFLGRLVLDLVERRLLIEGAGREARQHEQAEHLGQ